MTRQQKSSSWACCCGPCVPLTLGWSGLVAPSDFELTHHPDHLKWVFGMLFFNGGSTASFFSVSVKLQHFVQYL